MNYKASKAPIVLVAALASDTAIKVPGENMHLPPVDKMSNFICSKRTYRQIVQTFLPKD